MTIIERKIKNIPLNKNIKNFIRFLENSLYDFLLANHLHLLYNNIGHLNYAFILKFRMIMKENYALDSILCIVYNFLD